MRPRCGLRALVALAPLVSPTRSLALDGTPNWTFSLVSQAPGGVTHISSPKLTFDHYGTPALTWSRVDHTLVTTNQIFHSELTPLGIWSHRQLATGTGVGLTSALSYDRSERPHIAWIGIDFAVTASFDFSTPQTLSPNPQAATVQTNLSLRHDLAGTLRGIYAGQSAGVIGQVSWSGSTYSVGTLTTIPSVSSVERISFAIDHRGLRHVIMDARSQPSNTPSVILASEPANNSAWASAVYASGSNVGGVDVDSNPANGNVGFAYSVRNGATSELYFVESNGSFLTSTLVRSSDTFEIGDVSLAFDASDGQPAIAWEDITTGRLLFSYRDAAGQWGESLVDASISTSAAENRPRAPSLAFNDFGTGWPAIAYVDADGSLRVAFDPPGVPEPATLVLTAMALPFLRIRGGAGRNAAA